MTEKLINCPACYSKNLDDSVYCCQCGSPMRKGITLKVRGRKHWIAILVNTLILTVILTSAIQLIISFRTSQHAPVKQEKPEQTDLPVRGETVEPAAQPSRNDKPVPESIVSQSRETKQAEIKELVIGKVAIVNPDGFNIAELPAAVISGSWLALPSRACLGGNKWFFKVGDKEAVPIEGGLWSRGDAVGFWRLAGETEFEGPVFTAWQQEIPVRHLSMTTGKLSEPMTLTSAVIQGSFIKCSIPKDLDPGVFMQQDKVVGWSFGDVLDGAYMWPLGPDTDLLYTNYVDDFYNETFAGGREEQITAALTVGRDLSPQRQLQMFTEGFRLPPKLTPEETPRYLLPETVYPFISKLVKYLMDQGAYHYVAPLVEEPLLRETSDPELVINVILATQRIYGAEAALNFIEGTGSDILQSIGEEKTTLVQFYLKLYLARIRILLDNGDTLRARQILGRALPRFNESPELHLYAVELALAERDWEEAERLLYQREYPDTLKEKAMLLSERVSDLKGQENKIVIRFQPGSSDIQIEATVNEQYEQGFVVDTGASFVTVPYATVVSLGLEDDMSQYLQEVQTAGGPVNARSVTLSSIELQGWVVSEVEAFVMDLPDRPGIGLLGLNFLNRFRMDLQANEGILVLEPK